MLEEGAYWGQNLKVFLWVAFLVEWKQTKRSKCAIKLSVWWFWIAPSHFYQLLTITKINKKRHIQEEALDFLYQELTNHSKFSFEFLQESLLIWDVLRRYTNWKSVFENLAATHCSTHFPLLAIWISEKLPPAVLESHFLY